MFCILRLDDEWKLVSISTEGDLHTTDNPSNTLGPSSSSSTDTTLKDYTFSLDVSLKFADQKGRRTHRGEIYMCEASHPSLSLRTTAGGSSAKLLHLSGPRLEASVSKLPILLDGGNQA
jgi:hypothetical protein